MSLEDVDGRKLFEAVMTQERLICALAWQAPLRFCGAGTRLDRRFSVTDPNQKDVAIRIKVTNLHGSESNCRYRCPYKHNPYISLHLPYPHPRHTSCSLVTANQSKFERWRQDPRTCIPGSSSSRNRGRQGYDHTQRRWVRKEDPCQM